MAIHLFVRGTCQGSDETARVVLCKHGHLDDWSMSRLERFVGDIRAAFEALYQDPQVHIRVATTPSPEERLEWLLEREELAGLAECRIGREEGAA